MEAVAPLSSVNGRMRLVTLRVGSEDAGDITKK